MGRKGSDSVIDLFVGLFKIAFGLIGLVGMALVGLVKIVRFAVGKKAESSEELASTGGRKPTLEDFHYTGDTKEESFANYLNALGVPPKPKFKQFSRSGSTVEESQQNFLNALQEWKDKYEVLVYGSKWEDGDDENDDDE